MVTFNILVLIVVVFAPSARAILRVVDSALEPRGPAWTTFTFRYYGPQGGGAEAAGKPLFLKPDALCDLSKSPDSVAGRIVVAEADGATGCSLHRTYRILNSRYNPKTKMMNEIDYLPTPAGHYAPPHLKKKSRMA